MLKREREKELDTAKESLERQNNGRLQIDRDSIHKKKLRGSLNFSGSLKFSRCGLGSFLSA